MKKILILFLLSSTVILWWCIKSEIQYDSVINSDTWITISDEEEIVMVEEEILENGSLLVWSWLLIDGNIETETWVIIRHNNLEESDLFSEEELVQIIDKLKQRKQKKEDEYDQFEIKLKISEWDFSAEYFLTEDYLTDTDKIVINISWKEYLLSGEYNEQVKEKYLEALEEWSCESYEDPRRCANRVSDYSSYINGFKSLDSFSPDWKYLIYKKPFGYYWFIDIDKWINFMDAFMSDFVWINNWDRLIYWLEDRAWYYNYPIWLFITNTWDITDAKDIQSWINRLYLNSSRMEDYSDEKLYVWSIIVDDIYIYTLQWGFGRVSCYCANNFTYIKIYDLENFEEVYSSIIDY